MSFAELTESKPLSSLLTEKNWGLIRPDTACIEHYKFSPSGTVEIIGGQEIVTGHYSILSSDKGFELPAVIITFETDNQKADCTGSTENQIGIKTINFIKKESDQKIFFCDDSLGKKCPVYLRPEF